MIDPIGRKIDYLRVSVTDRCNERCLYCLPEDFHEWLPRQEILTYEEITKIIELTAGLGVGKYRITGGEPLVRKEVAELISNIYGIKGVEHVTLTTNATLLENQADALYKAGLRRVNISLDALEPEKYHSITGGSVERALSGIMAAKEVGMGPIKLNCVLMRNKNEDQLIPLIEFAAKHDFIIRFIELMPISLTEVLNESNFFPLAEAKRKLEQIDSLELLERQESFGFGPARYYRMPKLGVTVGFIGAMTDLHFCDNCNKMRLTCDGKLRPCLGNHLETDLKPALRPLNVASLRELIQQTLFVKPDAHIFRENYQPNRIMTAIGG